ncbi:hypothetical protein CAPTEDRAFT_85592, partial [Capitella teleta]
YECSICGKKYPSKWLHNEHMGYHLNRRNFVCDTCGKKFRSKQELKDHSKYAHIAEQFPHQCAHCRPRIFFDLSSIAEHHSGPIKVAERYMCEYCGDLFTTKSMKFAHRRIEHGYRKLPLELRQARPECEICGKKFVYRDSLKKHYLHTHSDERKHECPTCGKTFKRHADKEYHVNTMHMNIYKYFCNICGHGVHRKQYLKNHQCTRT